jgi:hypothetical protein
MARKLVAHSLSEGKMPSPEEMASALMRYPNSEDVAFARQQGFDYAHPQSEYLNNMRATVYKKTPNVAGYFSNHNVNELPNQDMSSGSPFSLNDAHMRAALAAKRSALATLGLDPAKTVMGIDAPRLMLTKNGRQVGEIGGAYIPKTGQTFMANRDLEEDPSTIVHEAIHRGTHRLMNTPYWDPAWNQLGVPLVKGVSSSERFPEGNQGAHNEDVVRWLMQSKMGNPEGGRPGSLPGAQKQEAEQLFSPDFQSGRNNAKMLADMEAAAARYLKDRNPRGPR